MQSITLKSFFIRCLHAIEINNLEVICPFCGKKTISSTTALPDILMGSVCVFVDENSKPSLSYPNAVNKRAEFFLFSKMTKSDKPSPSRSLDDEAYTFVFFYRI